MTAPRAARRGESRIDDLVSRALDRAVVALEEAERQGDETRILVNRERKRRIEAVVFDDERD